jgi:L-ascorbate metabolism protein UlaG (beta-lactamase superfamily)
MKLSKTFLFLLLFTIIISCKNEQSKNDLINAVNKIKISDTVKIIPITHGTLILETDTEVIYIDPTGGAEAFEGQKPPTMVLITDIHGDHLSTKTLEALNLADVTIITPKAVSDAIPSTIAVSPRVLNNGETITINGITIEAIPMYNLREEALKYHTKGRGNGYVLTIKNERIYISGDTEDIPEIRDLKDIDKAFVCMNLPYTMTVERAASAVVEFKPKRVYPYHYRGTNGLSDINRFKNLVNEGDSSIDVIFLDWY